MHENYRRMFAQYQNRRLHKKQHWKVNQIGTITASVQSGARQSYDIIYKSLAFFLILYYPIMYIHELGHCLVCAFEGDQVVELYVTWTGEGHSSCIPEPNNQFLYHLLGGGFASMISAILLLAWRGIPNYVKIVSLTFVISHGVNAIVEAFAYDSYISDHFMRYALFNVITFVLFAGLLILYIRRHSFKNP